ncbi:pyrroline-5-carboxylate reductase [Parvibium lacunae]|uniref:Pyrroline-5-carboxylate reductase n=1 Tax=Parvibium lacunae TaxID=1888893 RepID=A0A368L3T9_9BURK|nr:pyrroline-5-carboxylate reductase [Parvibium lacunae]RCS58258.1 pyrroline-5-carboxylate reductase [Parvibium lacunae]
MKIGFIGGGNMANALIGGLVKQIDPTQIWVVEINAEARAKLAEQYGVQTQATLDHNLQALDVVVLAVKPQSLPAVAQALQPYVQQALIISIAAGIRATDLSRWLGGHPRIVRTMPNTPALIGLGVTGMAALPAVNTADRASATQIMQAVGQTVWLEQESQLDAVTALSGSGPAYVFYFMESMLAAGQQMGLSADQAQTLVMGTFVGAAQLAAQASDPVSTLRERVTSKGGTTAAALEVLAAQQVNNQIQSALEAARLRAMELGDELGGATP